MDGILAKLDGAEQRLRALEKPIREGAVTDLVKTGTDRDRHGRVRVRVKAVGEIPKEWHVWIGECIHDMRTALDHLAFALNVAGSERDPPPNERASEFPIFDDGLAYRGKRPRIRGAEKMICCFPWGARTRIERLQPYHRRKDPDTRRLWELRELANIDKHRRFPIMDPTNQIMVGPANMVEGHAVTKVRHRYRRLEPNATIMWLEVPTLPLSVKEPQVQFGKGVEIEFDGRAKAAPIPLIEPHESVLFVLESILEFIRERVVPEFQPFLV